MSNKRLDTSLKKTALFAFIIGFISVFLLHQTQTTKAQGTSNVSGSAKPNIIFILADDMDADSMRFMPKLQSLLVREGVSFENYFVSLPLCCPSRVTTLRGQYAHNHNIITNGLPGGGFAKTYKTGLEKSTVAVWLGNAGYDTVMIGKYLNLYPDGAQKKYIPPGWTRWFGSMGGGTDGYNYNINENGTIVSYGANRDDYATDVYSKKAVRFIKNSGAKPFFMYVAPNAPHKPATPAKRHEKLFPGATFPRTPSFNEKDVSDKPDWIKSNPLHTAEEIFDMDTLYRNRLRSLAAVDDMIENIINALKKTGKLQNTYIFFTSDNGFHLGQHRLGSGKNTAYEEDIRVPFIVRGPTIDTNTTVGQLAGNVDLAPTFAELAGAQIPSFVDGRSLTPLLGASRNGLPTEWRQEFLIEGFKVTPDTADETPYQPSASGIERPGFFAIRSQNAIFIEYATGEKEYYDLAADPYQLDNKAGSLDSELLDKLSAKAQALKSCASDTCRSEETSLP